MMQRTSPFFTTDPTSTNDGALGSGERKKVPTIGDFTIAKSTSSEAAAAGAATSSSAAGDGAAAGCAAGPGGANDAGGAANAGVTCATPFLILILNPSRSSSN